MNMKPFKKGLHIFRRDLRVVDNTALLEASQQCEEILPCFIFDPRQLKDNPFRGDMLVQFMLECLEDLSQEIQKTGGKLYFFHGKHEEVISQLIANEAIDAVYCNRDYTPYSRERDRTIKELVETKGRKFFSYADALLTQPEQVHKDDGTPYTIYTPFYKKAKHIPIAKPKKTSVTNWFRGDVSQNEVHAAFSEILDERMKPLYKGGRSEALKILSQMDTFAQYKEERDIPILDKTTHLSPHHKFGTVSVREVYHAVIDAFDVEHHLIREIFWRDFFTHIAFHFPKVFGNAFQDKYNKLTWNEDEEMFQRWCEGKTGFPIVDAGMRELNATGYMHNRVRMIVASFLVKDLHIDWKKGERYFAQKLLDYDPAVNNGNWQWAASTGCDAQPYFRIFNPWLQQKRFDPECEYIKKWIPELAELDIKSIHQLADQRPLTPLDYPECIVEHREEAEKAKLQYKVA